MTDHLLISLEFSFFIYSLLGGLSMTDHLLISLEFSFFILYSFFIYFYLFRTLFLCIRLLELDLVNFLQISVSHQAL